MGIFVGADGFAGTTGSSFFNNVEIQLHNFFFEERKSIVQKVV
jgi:hypothetical protein